MFEPVSMSQAELSVTTPGKLIRWHYLWYAAAALVVMVAVIASGHLWSLNFVHVFSGLLWTGIDLFMGFVLVPNYGDRYFSLAPGNGGMNAICKSTEVAR